MIMISTGTATKQYGLVTKDRYVAYRYISTFVR